MRIDRRQLLMAGGAVAAGAVAASALQGCASGDNASTDGPVRLRMATWGSEKHLQVFQEIGDEYVKNNPDKVSEVVFDSTTVAEYTRALTTQVAGGDPPDLAWVLEQNCREFVEGGVLYDLTTAFSTEAYDLPDVVPASLEHWSTDDGIFGYPFSNSPFGIFVNLDLTKSADLPDPVELYQGGQWTWDKINEMAAAAASATGKGGAQHTGSGTSWIEHGAVWSSWGAEPWTVDGSQASFDAPPMVSYFDWLHEAMFDRGSFVKVGETFNFNAGEVAFKCAKVSTSAQLEGFDWAYLPLPAGPEKQVNVVGQAGVGVLANSKNPDAAADFLAFFTNQENSKKMAKFFPSPRKSVLTLDVLKDAMPQLTAEQIQEVVINSSLQPTWLSVHSKYAEFADGVEESLDQINQPNADVHGLLTSMNDAVASVIAG